MIWLESDGPDKDVVISSRVRLARNLAGFPFVNRAKREDRRQILDMLRTRLLDQASIPEMLWFDLCELTALERNILVERHLISKQHAKGTEPRAVAISAPDEQLSIMINEEDHLRLQVMRPGLALSDAFVQIDGVDDRLESTLDYALSGRFGYLTACPTNVGTGIRVSAMLHLPGLKLTGEIEKVRRAAKGMNIAVRGFYGEGSEAAGDFYQISNQVTLGRSERDILDSFERLLLPQVLDYERLARKSLINKRRMMLEDQVHRALGTLLHARLLKANEALELLSIVRLGVILGIVEGIPRSTIGRLVLLTQPAHLQRVCNEELDQARRRIARATLVRDALAETRRN